MPRSPARSRTRENFDVGGFFTERELDRGLVETGLVRGVDETDAEFNRRRAACYVAAAAADFGCFRIARAVAGWRGARVVFRGQEDGGAT